jgi:predicted nucleotidyltransferase
MQIDRDQIAAFCRRHHIKRLALFGSVLRDDFRPDSDVDVLVEFEADHVPGLIRFSGIEREFGDLLGRHADMHTFGGLKARIRQRVIGEAEALYAA